MPSENVINAIRNGYKTLKGSLPSFEPRSHQNYMVAEVAKALDGDNENNIIVVEAGTGTGKSLGYLMATIPVALAHERQVVISTATVALQEQLIEKDLPFYNENIAPINYVLAKGKGRYCCTATLTKVVANIDGTVDDQMQIDFKMEDEDRELLKELLASFKSGKWDGERDSLKQPIKEKLWSLISSQGTQCKKTAEHSCCPFHSARAGMAKADVIVANHALVAMDLSFGGGVILSEPEATYYVFDEAHHLPNIVRDADKNHFSLTGSSVWLDNFFQSIQKNQQEFMLNEGDIEKIFNEKEGMIGVLNDLQVVLSGLNFKDGVCRFSNGVLPASILPVLGNLKSYSSALSGVFKTLEKNLKDNTAIDDEQRNKITSDLDFHESRHLNIKSTLAMVLSEKDDVVYAKWLSKDEDMKISIHANTLDVSGYLHDNLFERAAGVVLTSATISTLNNFEYFKMVSGVPSESMFIRLSSPFDYPNNAELYVPKLKNDPSSAQFNDELISQVRELVLNSEHKSHLVLFTAYSQMKAVAEVLEVEVMLAGGVFGMQGKGSRSDILSKHRESVAKGLNSVLFGCQSFSEGLDLQGDLLTQVVITKIPFAVPSEPVEEAYAELIQTRGGNPFFEISLPEASRKVIQSAGRLIRTKSDSGRVVILDKRIVTKGYGEQLIGALPPFRKNIAA